MIPAAFDYAVAESVDDAIRLLAEGGDDAKLLAGGHSLLPLMKLRFTSPSLLGAFLMQQLNGRYGLGRILVMAFVLTPAPLVLVPLAQGAPVSPTLLVGIAEFLNGLGVMILDVGLGALYAATVPDQLRARVSGSFLLVNYGVRPIGALAGGLLAALIGLQTTMWIAAVGAIAGVLWLLPSPMPRLRELPQTAVDYSVDY